jgi:hypothetical protein
MLRRSAGRVASGAASRYGGYNLAFRFADRAVAASPSRSLSVIVGRSGVAERLAAAALLSGLLWLAIAWALA